MKLFFLKLVNTFINPMQVTSIYRAADSVHVVMANGSDFTISEEEYTLLVAYFDHNDKPDLTEVIKTAVAEAIKAAKE